MSRERFFHCSANDIFGIDAHLSLMGCAKSAQSTKCAGPQGVYKGNERQWLRSVVAFIVREGIKLSLPEHDKGCQPKTLTTLAARSPAPPSNDGMGGGLRRTVDEALSQGRRSRCRHGCESGKASRSRLAEFREACPGSEMCGQHHPPRTKASAQWTSHCAHHGQRDGGPRRTLCHMINRPSPSDDVTAHAIRLHASRVSGGVLEAQNESQLRTVLKRPPAKTSGQLWIPR